MHRRNAVLLLLLWCVVALLLADAVLQFYFPEATWQNVTRLFRIVSGALLLIALLRVRSQGGPQVSTRFPDHWHLALFSLLFVVITNLPSSLFSSGSERVQRFVLTSIASSLPEQFDAVVSQTQKTLSHWRETVRREVRGSREDGDRLFLLCREIGLNLDRSKAAWVCIVNEEGKPLAWWFAHEGISLSITPELVTSVFERGHCLEVGPLFVSLSIAEPDRLDGGRVIAGSIIDQTITSRPAILPDSFIPSFRQSLPRCVQFSVTWNDVPEATHRISSPPFSENGSVQLELPLTINDMVLANCRFSLHDGNYILDSWLLVSSIVEILLFFFLISRIGRLSNTRESRERHVIMQAGFLIAAGWLSSGMIVPVSPYFLEYVRNSVTQQVIGTSPLQDWLQLFALIIITFAYASLYKLILDFPIFSGLSQQDEAPTPGRRARWHALLLLLFTSLLPAAGLNGSLILWQICQNHLMRTVASRDLDISMLTISILPLGLSSLCIVIISLLHGLSTFLVWWNSLMRSHGTLRLARFILSSGLLLATLFFLSVPWFVFLPVAVGIPTLWLTSRVVSGPSIGWSLHWRTLSSTLLIIVLFLLSSFQMMLSQKYEMERGIVGKRAIAQFRKPDHVTAKVKEYLASCAARFTTSPFQIAHATDEAFRIWAESPFIDDGRAVTVSFYRKSGELLGQFGFIGYHPLEPDLESGAEKPLFISQTSGKWTLRFLQLGTDVTSEVNRDLEREHVVLLMAVEYSSFPLQTSFGGWPDIEPSSWLRNQSPRLSSHILQTEYRMGLALSSGSGIRPPLPDEPKFYARLNHDGSVWLKNRTFNSQVYDILFIQPELTGGGPDFVSLAFPRVNRSERLFSAGRWFFLCLLFSIMVVGFRRLGTGLVRLIRSIRAGGSPAALITYRFRVMAALLILSIIPFLSVLYLFKQSHDQQVRQSLEEEARTMNQRTIESLKQRVESTAAFFSSWYLRTTSSDRDDLDLESEFLHTRNQLSQSISSLSIRDSQGFALLEWTSADKASRDNSGSDEIQRALAFWRGTPVVSFIRSRNRIDLMATVPLISTDRPDFPLGTVTVAIPVETELLQEIGERLGQSIAIYSSGELIAMTNPSLAEIGIVSPFLAPSIVLQTRADKTASIPRISQNERRTKLETYQPLSNSIGDLTSVLRTFSSLPTATLSDDSNSLYQELLLVLLPGFLLIISTGFWLAYRFSRPMSMLLEGTRRITSGSLDHVIPRVSDVEFDTLIDAFNAMTHELAEDREILEHRRRTIEAILENVSSGILVFDDKNRLITTNKAAKEILDLEHMFDLVGQDAHSVLGQSILKSLAVSILERRENEGRQAFEARATRDSRSVFLQVTLSEFGLKHQPGGWILAVEDLTDLIDSNRRAALVDMARQVAHEVKNPLTPIQLSTEHLIETYRDGAPHFNEILTRCTTTILSQVKNLRRITSEFSTFARLPQPNLLPEDLNSLVLDLLSGQTDDMQGDPTISFHPGDIPTVILDRGLIEQVLLNLLTNARQAITVSGKITISTGQGLFHPSGPFAGEADVGTSQTIWLAIQDSGEGIEHSVRDRIFEPYFSTKEAGSGLGLAISKNIMIQHHGDIFAYSRNNIGSLFLMLFPGEDPDSKPGAEHENEEPEPEGQVLK